MAIDVDVRPLRIPAKRAEYLTGIGTVDIVRSVCYTCLLRDPAETFAPCRSRGKRGVSIRRLRHRLENSSRVFLKDESRLPAHKSQGNGIDGQCSPDQRRIFLTSPCAASSRKFERRQLEILASSSKGRMPLHVRIVGVECGQFFLRHEFIPCHDGFWNGQRFRCLKVEGHNLLRLNGNCVGA